MYTLDGNNFDDLDGFYDEFERAFNIPYEWGRNDSAMMDLCSDCPKPSVIIWKNTKISRQRLGHECRAKELKEFLKDGCHSDHFEEVNRAIAAAENGEGDTTFDILVRTLTCPPSSALRGHVSLRLE